MTDLGGQKAERRNWGRIVDNPTAIIFFAALSDYNVRSLTDSTKSKLDEALEIWNSVCLATLLLYLER